MFTVAHLVDPVRIDSLLDLVAKSRLRPAFLAILRHVSNKE